LQAGNAKPHYLWNSIAPAHPQQKRCVASSKAAQPCYIAASRRDDGGDYAGNRSGFRQQRVAWALAGMLLGLYMGIAADNKLLVMHVALMLTGFVTLAIYGMLYRMWPAMAKSPLARMQFWVSSLGAAGIIMGSYFFATSGSVPLVATSSIVFIAGGALMAWLFIAKARDI
jgi:hypothetical protein